MGRFLSFPTVRRQVRAMRAISRSKWNDGVDGAPNGISVPRWSLSKPHLKRGRLLGKSIQKLSSVTRVRLDLAKKVFEVHAVDANGEIVVARKLARGKLVGFFSELPPCVVAMVACPSAHHWGGSYGANSGHSRGERCRRAFRPSVPSTDVVCYDRLTSIRAIRSLATNVRSGSGRRVRGTIPSRPRP